MSIIDYQCIVEEFLFVALDGLLVFLGARHNSKIILHLFRFGIFFQVENTGTLLVSMIMLWIISNVLEGKKGLIEFNFPRASLCKLSLRLVREKNATLPANTDF